MSWAERQRDGKWYILVESKRRHCYCFSSYRTEQFGIAVTPYVRIREVLNSNLGWIIGCMYCLRHFAVSSIHPWICLDSTYIRPRPPPLKSFSVHHSSYHWHCIFLILTVSSNKPQTNELLPRGRTLDWVGDCSTWKLLRHWTWLESL
jgi:hypothetical protein